MSGANWRVTWYKAIDAANAEIAARNKEVPVEQRVGLVPRHNPHACRHTAASWLVQAGVPLYNIKNLLGHASSATTEIYAHLAPGVHSVVEDAWERIDAHQVRIGSR